MSADTGFALGAAPCASGHCTVLVTTHDAGRSWSAVATLPPAVDGGDPAVAKVRFANPSDGWAFGRQLWSTHDGGRNWRQSGGPLSAVGDLETAGGVAYAIAATAATCAQPPCAGGGKLFRTPVGRDAWQAVGGVALGEGTGSIALHSRAAWVVSSGGPGAVSFFSSSDGTAWHRLDDPCARVGSEWALAGVAPVSSTSAYLLCVGGAGAGSEDKRVLFSTDGGAHGTATGADPPRGGLADGIAAASPAVVAVSARSGASWVYRSGDSGHTWTAPLERGDGGVGYADLGFTTASQGVAIYGNPMSGTASQLLMTRNAGASWSPVTF
ncbi:MAG: hypothetical protein QOJ62_1205 [Actinomycetota bacterium]|nr:hypothetical protein [Actinomycetota bacterium]